MKAIILAGGEGTRLRPITDNIPKAIIPFQGKTLTEHVLDILKKYGLRDIILSVAYKKEMLKKYFGDGKKFDVRITYIEEPEPLGTAGPFIILNKQNRTIKETFFTLNGDNLFKVNLRDMLLEHKEHSAIATIALSKVKDPKSYGVVILDGDYIVKFVEKPKDYPPSYINSGYYIFEPEIFKLVEGKDKAMIEKDIFPILAEQKKLFGFKCNGLWFDTGTLERYEQANKEWRLSD